MISSLRGKFWNIGLFSAADLAVISALFLALEIWIMKWGAEFEVHEANLQIFEHRCIIAMDDVREGPQNFAKIRDIGTFFEKTLTDRELSQ